MARKMVSDFGQDAEKEIPHHHLSRRQVELLREYIAQEHIKRLPPVPYDADRDDPLTGLGTLGTRYDAFDSFEFETLDGYTVRVLPSPTGKVNTAHLMLEWAEQATGGPELRYRWVGEVNPQVLNYGLNPAIGISLQGIQWLYFEDGRTRKSPAVFQLKVSMAVWNGVALQLHAAWGTASHRPSMLNG